MNLMWVTALVIDPDKHSVNILSGMLEGFGLVKQRVVETGEAATSVLKEETVDIVFCEGVLPDISSADFIRWLRRLEPKPVRLVPVVVMTGYTQGSLIQSVRDAGANIVIKKPFAPEPLYDRLKWVSRGSRRFVEAAGYVGPDRRFKFAGLPDGIGRRATDLSGALGEPTEPNLSQEEIDSMIKPMKMDL